MREIVLYIAMSLDGYIADMDGGVDWLEDYSVDEDSGLSGLEGMNPLDMGSYPEFIRDIDTVIMGYRTYHQVVTQLSPDVWPYEELTSYVVTHKQQEEIVYPNITGQNIIFTREDPSDLIEHLRKQEGKSIWICGGAKVVDQLVEADRIDKYWITVMPVILGAGIPLFHENNRLVALKLFSVRKYQSMVDMVYIRKDPSAAIE